MPDRKAAHLRPGARGRAQRSVFHRADREGRQEGRIQVHPAGNRDRQERPVPEATGKGGPEMTKTLQITRRTALRGLGVSVALPLLDAMQPGLLLGAPAVKPPRRMAFLYVP